MANEIASETFRRRNLVNEYPTQNIELCAKDEEIAQLKTLLVLAANALENKAFNQINQKDWDLIDELRKAAE